MVKLTQQTISIVATAMINNPKEDFVVYETGEIGVEKGGRYVRLTGELVPRTQKEPKQVWRGNVKDLTDTVNPKLTYKTHLTKYLYQEMNAKLKGSQIQLTGKRVIDDILVSKKYRDYLRNERVEMNTQEISGDTINITTSGTSFAHHQLIPKKTKEDLQSLYETARVSAVNDSRATVKRPYTYKKLIDESYGKYEEAYRQYMKDFRNLQELWQWKLNGDGIHVGYTNDDIYHKVILPVEFRLQKMGYNNKIMRQFARMEHSLKETIKKGQDERIISYEVRI